MNVHMTYHDDWIVNVLLEDGRVYSFWTEMWPEHGWPDDDRNWPAVERAAQLRAISCAHMGLKTWSLEELPKDREQFIAGMTSLCRMTNDADFRRYMRS